MITIQNSLLNFCKEILMENIRFLTRDVNLIIDPRKMINYEALREHMYVSNSLINSR